MQVGWQKACESFFTRNMIDNLEEEVNERTSIENLYDLEQMEQDCGYVFIHTLDNFINS